MTDQIPEVEVSLSPEHASTNFYWTLGKEEVFNLQTTIRGVVSRTQVDAHLAGVIDAMKAVVYHGGHAKPVGQQPAASGGNGHASPAPVAAPPVAVAEKPLVEGIGAYDGVFDAVELVGSMSGGKTYWKVKGGSFTKFGVTIWPETLKAAGLSPELDPAQAYSLQGYKAYFTNKPEGKPDKVVKLEK